MNNGSLTALYLLHSLGLRLCRAVEAQYHSSTFSFLRKESVAVFLLPRAALSNFRPAVQWSSALQCAWLRAQREI